jgi:hypothetical protein
MDLTQVHEDFLDVDFWSASQSAGRLMGCSAPRNFSTEPLGSERNLFSAVDEVIPMEKWDDIIERKNAENSWLADLVPIVHDQDGEGSCVAESATAEWEIKCVETLGLDNFIPLSAASLYRRTGSSPNSGSTLFDNRVEMTRRGALPLDTPENRARFKHVHRAVGFRVGLPDGWEETAALFAHDEYVDIEDVETFGSAILKNHPVTYARSGHCITAVKIFGSVRQNTLKFGYLNSWSLDWGGPVNARLRGGMGYDSLSTVRRVAAGATALRSIRVPEFLLKKG